MKPVVFGLSGPVLNDEERAFFTGVDPAGYILFRRNILDGAQLRTLTDNLRALHGRDALAIMIDQEGGPVARMGPPIWPDFPAVSKFDALYERAPISALEAVRVNARAIGRMLADVGINVNIAPVLDVRRAETDSSLGTRTFGSDPMRIASMGAAMLGGLRQAGVIGVIKHIPGQGRAMLDTHHHLAVVEASDAELADDLFPFERLNDAPIALTGHVLFSAWDAEHPATMSPTIIRDIIRARIGFDGLLISDDLDMAALSGDIAGRAADCLAAGCDVALHCSGTMTDMTAIAERVPDMTDSATVRLARAMTTVETVDDTFSIAALIAKRDELLALV